MIEGNKPIIPQGFSSIGLTKRELFAAMAMQGMLANGATYGNHEEFATWSVKSADALLAELAKENQQ